MSLKITLVFAGGILLFSCAAFKKNAEKSSPVTTFRILEDTVNLSIKNDFAYTIEIFNNGKKPLVHFKKYLLCGYPNDPFNDYYLDAKKKINGKLQNYEFDLGHYIEAEYVGEYIDIPPNKSNIYEDINHLYPFDGPGMYYFRAVFTNDYRHLATTNYDSVYVVVK